MNNDKQTKTCRSYSLQLVTMHCLINVKSTLKQYVQSLQHITTTVTCAHLQQDISISNKNALTHHSVYSVAEAKDKEQNDINVYYFFQLLFNQSYSLLNWSLKVIYFVNCWIRIFYSLDAVRVTQQSYITPTEHRNKKVMHAVTTTRCSATIIKLCWSVQTAGHILATEVCIVGLS